MKGRIKNTERRNLLPIIGQIKVGEKSEKGVPRSLDYFKATGQYAPLFHSQFGEQPQRITTVFVSDNIEDVCNERWEVRQGAKLYAQGDGETFQVYNPQTDKYEEQKTTAEALAKACNGKAEKRLILRFIIPELKGILGAWQFSTKAEASTMPQIISVFDTVQNTAGSVINIPMDLIVEKVTSQSPGSKSSYPVVKLIPNVSTQALERVQEAINAGVQFKGLLTEDRIEQLENTPAALPDSRKKGDYEAAKKVIENADPKELGRFELAIEEREWTNEELANLLQLIAKRRTQINSENNFPGERL